MTRAARVAGDENVRLFCGLRLPDDAADAIAAWQAGARPRAGRAARQPALHARLPRPAASLAAGRGRRGAAAPRGRDRAAGLRAWSATARRAASACSSSRSDEGAERLALGLQRDLLGRAERDTWLPHVTVLRFRERPRLRPPLPELGPFVTSEAAAYLSVLRPTGAEYVVLESVRLGGSWIALCWLKRRSVGS